MLYRPESILLNVVMLSVVLLCVVAPSVEVHQSILKVDIFENHFQFQGFFIIDFLTLDFVLAPRLSA